MRVNSLLGMAAVAGAAYFLRTDKGKNLVNEYKGQFEGWFNKSGEAIRNMADKFTRTNMHTPPVS